MTVAGHGRKILKMAAIMAGWPFFIPEFNMPPNHFLTKKFKRFGAGFDFLRLNGDFALKLTSINIVSG